jgi:hypothetical protein
MAGYIVEHYCLMFDRGVVHIVLAASHNDMNHSSVKHQTVMVNNITSHNNMNHSSVKPEIAMVNNISSHSNMNSSSVKRQRSGSYCCGW